MNPRSTAGALDARSIGASVRSIVNTGHKGAVLALEYDEQRRFLLSGGEDGTVRLWDARASTLVRKVQVTNLTASMLAIDPAATRFAVVETDGIRSFFLSVWDWETETRLFRVPLRGQPLFLRYSVMGGHLMYGESAWDSLRVLGSADGSAVAFHPEGFGIVGFAEISRSEKTIMTYQISGRISYWDLASGELVKDLGTVPSLFGLRISRDRRWLVGSTGGEIVVVDTLSGEARSRVAVSSVLSVDISPEGDEVAGVVLAEDRRSIGRWLIGEGAEKTARMQSMSEDQPDVLRFADEGIFAGGRSGVIAFLRRTGEASVFARDALAEISGFDVAKGMIATGSRDWIRLFDSDFLTGERTDGINPRSTAGAINPRSTAGAINPRSTAGAGKLSEGADPATGYIRSTLVENPFKAPVDMSFLPDGRLLLWRNDDSLGQCGIIDPATLVFREIVSDFHGPIMDARPVIRATADRGSEMTAGPYFLALEKGGIISLTDLATGAMVFENWVPGLSAIVATSGNELVGGRNAAASEGSLVRIDTRTGETVAIPNRNVFTYKLLFDEETGVLYSIGVDARGATNLLRHEGPGFERETLVDRSDAEDLFASLALDRSSHVLFSALSQEGAGTAGADAPEISRSTGKDGDTRSTAVEGNTRSTAVGVSAYEEGRIRKLPAMNAIPRGLVARDGRLFSLNTDSTISIAESATGRFIVELSVFTDGEWCALSADGGYAASPGGDARVTVFLGEIMSETRENYRLRVGLQEIRKESAEYQ